MYLFFDTETTGLPKNWKAPITDFENWPRLVQLAYQIFDNEGILIMERDYIIRPEGFIIPTEASAIHGITNERALLEGLNLSKVLGEFKLLLDEAYTIVAHNISFDEKIIGCEYLRLSLPNPLVDKNKICTMESSTNYCAISGPYGYKWPKLSELYYKLFKANFEEAHNAMIDIKATSKCFWELVKKDIIKLNNPIESITPENYKPTTMRFLEDLNDPWVAVEETEIELIPYRKGNKWGYCTSDKKIVIDCEFDMAFKFTEGIGRVIKNDRYGFIDFKGNFVTDIKYKKASEFNEGFAGVAKEYNKWNFINNQGEVVFNQKMFLNIRNFHNGLAGVVINDKLGFIDTYGRQVIPPIYDYHVWDDQLEFMLGNEINDGDSAFGGDNLYDIANFQEGCIRLKKNNKFGFADTNGNIIAPFIYDKAENFSEGLAHVGINNLKYDITDSGYIDKTGAFIIPLKYHFDDKMVWDYWRQSRFSEGKAVVRSVSVYRDYPEHRKGYYIVIDKNDNKLSGFDSYNLCSGFSEGLAVVSKSFGEYKFQKGYETKYGFIDINGNLAIDYRFEWAQSFSDGLAAIKMNGKYGFIDNSGKIVIECRYAKDFRRKRFINGLFFVQSGKFSGGVIIGKPTPDHGYINKMGVGYWED